MNPAFFIRPLKALLTGDVLNAVAYRLRPYEVVPGSRRRRGDALPSRSSAPRWPRSRSVIPALLWSAPRACARRDRPHDHQAQGLGHRRVLGDDHRGRRQLRLQSFLEPEGAESTSSW
jgi:hypothetical protein